MTKILPLTTSNVEALNARNRQHTSDMKSFALLDKLEQAKTESYDKEMAVGKQAEAKFRDAEPLNDHEEGVFKGSLAIQLVIEF